jgi:hypothetical protein
MGIEYKILSTSLFIILLCTFAYDLKPETETDKKVNSFIIPVFFVSFLTFIIDIFYIIWTL